MRLICPECGATASAATWANDAEAREVLAAIVKLPPAVVPVTLPYLGLFRPEKRALSWKRARALVTDLAAMIVGRSVQIQGRAARSCPPQIWVQAIEEMVARRDRLTLPLKNHNYLRTVAWPLADQADAMAERTRIQAEQSGNLRSISGAGDDEPGPSWDDLSDAEKSRLPESLRQRFTK